MSHPVFFVINKHIIIIFPWCSSGWRRFCWPFQTTVFYSCFILFRLYLIHTFTYTSKLTVMVAFKNETYET